MSRTPTLQDLALYARAHFEEDGSPFEEENPSSLDVVVAVYADEGDREGASARARTALRRRLGSRRLAVASPDVDEFVRAAVAYLRAVYPEPERVRETEERRFLSHLFWGHLVEARFAAGGA